MIKIIATPSPFEPVQNFDACKGMSLSGCIRIADMDDGTPVVAAIDGDWKLRDDWDQAVPDGAIVEVRRLFAGGGSLGSAFSTFIPQSGRDWAIFAATGGIGWEAYNLYNLFHVKTPDLPDAQKQPTQSPTYSLGGGNRMRVGQPVPVLYGRLKIKPDLIAESWAEYDADGNQFLTQVYCLGHGMIDADVTTDIFLGDTPLSAYANGETIIDVGAVAFDAAAYVNAELAIPVAGVATLSSAWDDLITSSETVTNQTLAPSTDIGPFPAAGPGTSADEIWVDLVAPRGLTDAGSTVDIYVDCSLQQLDNSGTAIGSATVMPQLLMTGNTVEQVRKTFKITPPVSGQRWQVTLNRATAGGSTLSRADEITWTALRTKQTPHLVYGNFTILIVRTRATGQLNGTSAGNLSIVGTRMLPVWNGASWNAEAVTRNPAWAFADACRNSVYGGGIPDARLDIAALYALATTWDTRGDSFDGVFDQQSTTWESITKIARAGRAAPNLVSGIVTIVRDGVKSTYSGLYSPEKMVDGSFSVQYSMRKSDDNDGIDGAYISSDNWQQSHILMSRSGVDPTTPFAVDMFGMTDPLQVAREVDFLTKQQALIRQVISWETELDGFAQSIGDLVAISHDVPSWGQSGQVLAVSGARLTLSEPPDFSAGGVHKILLRKPDGTTDGPHTATAVVGNLLQVDLATGPGFTVRVDLSVSERTAYAFGPSANYRKDVILTKIEPSGESHVRLTATPYIAALHVEREFYLMAPGADFDPASIPDPAGYLSDADGSMSDGTAGWYL